MAKTQPSAELVQCFIQQNNAPFVKTYTVTNISGYVKQTSSFSARSILFKITTFPQMSLEGNRNVLYVFVNWVCSVMNIIHGNKSDVLVPLFMSYISSLWFSRELDKNRGTWTNCPRECSYLYHQLVLSSASFPETCSICQTQPLASLFSLCTLFFPDIVHENLKMGSDGESDQASGTSSDEVQSPTGVCLRNRGNRRISAEVRIVVSAFQLKEIFWDVSHCLLLTFIHLESHLT